MRVHVLVNNLHEENTAILGVFGLPKKAMNRKKEIEAETVARDKRRVAWEATHPGGCYQEEVELLPFSGCCHLEVITFEVQ